MSGMHLSKEFFELLKAIGESKSKQEEDRIIQREISTLKKKMESGSSNGGSSVNKLSSKVGGAVGGGGMDNVLNQNRKKAKEFLVRLLYVGKKRRLILLCHYLNSIYDLFFYVTYL